MTGALALVFIDYSQCSMDAMTVRSNLFQNFAPANLLRDACASAAASVTRILFISIYLFYSWHPRCTRLCT